MAFKTQSKKYLKNKISRQSQLRYYQIYFKFCGFIKHI